MEELLKYEDLVPESTERPLPIQSLTEELWAKNLCWLQVWKVKEIGKGQEPRTRPTSERLGLGAGG